MAKTRQEKEQTIKTLAESIKSAKSTVLANFQGLKVVESEELRGICRKANVEYLASKKTLLKRALAEAGFDINTQEFEGGIAVVLGQEDEVAPAQIIANFAKSHDTVKIFGGVLEGKFIDEAKVTELSKLPSKLELYSKLVGTINAPVSGFVNVLSCNLRGLLNALNAIKEAKA